MNRESIPGKYDEVIGEEDVEAAVERLKVGKVTERDGTVPEFIKYGGTELLKALQCLFQKLLTEKAIPEEWEYNIIVPIHKKGDANECGNYRNICLSQVMYELYTSILEKKLREPVEKDLEEEQAAFRPEHQTQDHIFSLRTIIDKSWERGKSIFLASIDLKAGLDSLPS
nr:uncharacterized protein LOC106691662 [Halyomorpha halys]